jgi:serine/threonine protein kinase
MGRSRLGSFQRRVQIAIDVLTAIQFLHQGSSDKKVASCLHRDIKSANIVIMSDFTAKLIDCGLAKFVDVATGAKSATKSTKKSTFAGVKGTSGYICPQYVKTNKYSKACDFYSVGVVLLELWTGRLQNYEDESGDEFNFGEEYLHEGREVAGDVDAAMDLDDPLPGFSNRFTQLALECISERGNDRPSGEKVFERLSDILRDCSSRSVGDNNRGDSAFTDAACSARSAGTETCVTCRTTTVISPHTMCALCIDKKENREDYARNQAATQSVIT